jgi:chromosome segregation ATPase
MMRVQTTEDALAVMKKKEEKASLSVAESMSKLSGRINTMDKTISELVFQIGFNQQSLKNASNDIELMTAKLDGVKDELKLFSLQMEEAEGGDTEEADNEEKEKVDHHMNILLRIEQLETSQSKLRGELERELKKDTHAKLQDLSARFSKSTETITKHSAHLQGMDSEQKNHTGRLRTVERHIQDMDIREDVLGERMGACESKIPILADQQKDSTIKLGATVRELDKTRALQVQLTGDLKDTTSSLQKLTGTVGTTLAEVGAVSSRCEVAHEFLDGLSKGIQDTHRHAMAGTSGMLPPMAVAPNLQLPGVPTNSGAISARWTPERGTLASQRVILNQLQGGSISQASTRYPHSTFGASSFSASPTLFPAGSIPQAAAE